MVVRDGDEDVRERAGDVPSRLAKVWFASSRYLRTIVQFVIYRPRRFFERYDLERERYAEPRPFLVVNLLITSVVTSFVVASLTPTSHALGIAFRLTVMTLLNMSLGIYGCVALWLLLQPVRLSPIIAAFCYASAWLPLYLPVTANAIFVLAQSHNNGGTHKTVLIAAVVVQVLYCGYLISAMGRFSRLEGSLLRSFAILATAITLAINGVGGRWTSLRENNQNSEDVTWNTLMGDRATLYVNNRRIDCQYCWRTTTEAVAGDIISLDLFYHQSTDARTARKARARLEIPRFMKQAAVIGGEVWSEDSGERRADGFVSLTIKGSRPVVLELIDVTHYSGTNRSPVQLGWGARMENLLSSDGLLLGDIPPGWSFQGDVVARFEVVDAEGKPPLANPNHITATSACRGAQTTIALDWDDVPLAIQYVVYRDGVFLATARQSDWIDPFVIPNAVYSYSVRSCDDERCLDEGTTAIVTRAGACPKN